MDRAAGPGYRGEVIRLDANIGDSIVQSVLGAVARGDEVIALAAHPNIRASALRRYAADANESLRHAAAKLEQGPAPLRDGAAGITQLADRMQIIAAATQTRSAIGAQPTIDAVKGAVAVAGDVARAYPASARAYARTLLDRAPDQQAARRIAGVIELDPALVLGTSRMTKRNRAWLEQVRGRLREATHPAQVEALVEAVRLVKDPATTRASVRTMLAEALPSTFRQPTREELRVIAILDQLPEHLRPAEIPDAYRMKPLLSQFQTGRRSSDSITRMRVIELEMETAGIVADPATTRQAVASEFASYIDVPADQLTNQQLLRMAAIQRLPTELRPAIAQQGSVPLIQIYPMMKYFDAGVIDSELGFFRMLRERERIISSGAATAESLSREFDDLLSRGAASWSPADRTRLGAFDLLPPTLRPDLPEPLDDHYTLSKSLTEAELFQPLSESGAEVRNVRLHRARLALADEPGATREALTAQLRDLLALPNHELRDDRLLRVAAIIGAPDGVRPALPDAPNRHRFGWVFIKPDRFGEVPGAAIDLQLEHLRASLTLADEATRPAVAIVDELERLVGRESLDDDHWRRVRVLVNADDEIRAAFEPMLEYPHAGLYLPGIAPASRATDLGRVRAGVDGLRAAERSDQLAMDPTVTRDAMSAELSEILRRGDAELSRDDLLRMATIAGLPERIRPPIAPHTSGRMPRAHWLVAAQGERSAEASASLARQRGLVRVGDPAELGAFLRRLDDAAPDVSGDDLDDLAALVGTDPAPVRAAGASDDLLDRLVGDLEGGQHVRPRLTLARELIPPDGPNVAANAIAASTRELIQRNFDRYDGVLHDGFARDPDYADLGRIRANLSLLRALDAQPVNPPESVEHALPW